MKHTFNFLFLIIVLAIVGAQIVKADECKVTDPTGTPLNVRASPNGRILQTVKNDTIVFIEQTTYDSKNRPWVKISQSIGRNRKILGWVFREFISCYSATSEADWTTFLTKFKTAVRNRDITAVKSVMLETYDCRHVYFCFFIEPLQENYSREFFLQQLSKDNDKGWKGLEKVLTKGKLDIGKDYKFITLPTKLVNLPNNNCEVDFAVSFELTDNRWLFAGFFETSCH